MRKGFPCRRGAPFFLGPAPRTVPCAGRSRSGVRRRIRSRKRFRLRPIALTTVRSASMLSSQDRNSADVRIFGSMRILRLEIHTMTGLVALGGPDLTSIVHPGTALLSNKRSHGPPARQAASCAEGSAVAEPQSVGHSLHQRRRLGTANRFRSQRELEPLRQLQIPAGGGGYVLRSAVESRVVRPDHTKGVLK